MNWLEHHLRDYPGAILIVTHDRYFLDNVTGWILELDRGRGIPYEGNYSAYLGQKAKRFAQEAREDAARQKVLEREQEWIAASRPRRARPSPRPASRPMTNCSRSTRRALKSTTAQIIIPPGERLGDTVIDVEGLSKAYGDRLLIDESVLQAAARRHRRHHRAERRGQDHAVPHDHRPGEAGLGTITIGEQRAISAMSTRAATRSIPTRPSGRKSPAAMTSSISASAR